MKKIALTTALAAMLMFNCTYWRTRVGGASGASAGGAIGGVIGKKAGNTAAGAIIGAAIGGAAGAAIGNYMDRQAAEIRRDIKDAKVERVPVEFEDIENKILAHTLLDPKTGDPDSKVVTMLRSG